MENIEMHRRDRDNAASSPRAADRARFRTRGDVTVLNAPEISYTSIDIDEEPEFAHASRRRRPQRKRRGEKRDTALRCTFALYVISFVAFMFLYLNVKYFVFVYHTDRITKGGSGGDNDTKDSSTEFTSTERITEATTTLPKITCENAKELVFDKQKVVKSSLRFDHDGWCYYILETNYEDFHKCFIDVFGLSHFFLRGEDTQEIVINKVKEVGHFNDSIMLGFVLTCSSFAKGCDEDNDQAWVCPDVKLRDERLDSGWEYRNLETLKDWNFITPWQGCPDPLLTRIYEGVLHQGKYRNIEEARDAKWQLCEMKI